MLELLCLDLLGENRLENQSERVLESLSCPPGPVPTAAVDEEKEDDDSSPSPEKPKILAFFGPPLAAAATPLSTSAGADDGARSMGSPLVAGASPSGVECGARMPRFRMILNTYQNERVTACVMHFDSCGALWRSHGP